MTASAAPAPTAPAPTQRERPTNPAAAAWVSFRENSASHELTVLHEQGLYRHLRMAEPGTRMWSWDIVTWPGHLATSGDIADGLNWHRHPVTPSDIADGLTFSRLEDMIQFFAISAAKRAYYSDGAPSIDFRYWAEKLQGDQRQTVMTYKHEDFVRFVEETLTERLEDGYDPDLTPHKARRLIDEVNELEHYESEARAWLDGHADEFPDSWENSFKDYTFHFQVACYAINATVHAYLDRTRPPTQTEKDTQP
jgi:hypothetical protein